ncbi:cyclic nucleotide-binding domain protein (macronuclear) [Tetrahymena thermophila SB210]|uniref:Cyclic nucleotide-binding domain protein n=1 Tax=Tetrahymena thermophila (strain SB210) TaxID=312017 RepID=Q22NW1_TETTS|nr:cyclic nucleotide-binding domain protein [Tetrahymena thermophila SB210]EAR87050.3 cyclic nucleotide-binding domain protein [Tetrahymena thermophila SB210]|eukprot:XP_001007295.3 cyclic nucleotide-binding domain protein [Tetrahymena thermophila SB210]
MDLQRQEQEIRFYTIQKDIQSSNYKIKKELELINNRNSMSLVAFPEQGYFLENDSISPNDASIVVGAYNKVQRYQENGQSDDVQISFNSSKINEAELYPNQKNSSPTTYYQAKSFNNSTQELNFNNVIGQYVNRDLQQKDNEQINKNGIQGQLVSQKQQQQIDSENQNNPKDNQVQIQVKNIQQSMSNNDTISSQPQQLFNSHVNNNNNNKHEASQFKKEIICLGNPKKKQEEKRAVTNWHKMRELYKKNKPKQQITLEQYRLINDWASNEYKIIPTATQMMNLQNVKVLKQKNKIKKNSIIQSIFYVSDYAKQLEKAIFPKSDSMIPIQSKITHYIDDTIQTWVYLPDFKSSSQIDLYVESMSRVAFLFIGITHNSDNTNNFEKIFEIATFFLGITFFSFIIQQSINDLKESQKKKYKQAQEFNCLISYLGKQKIKTSLKVQILSYLKSYHTEEFNIVKNEGTSEALSKLSDKLRKELLVQVNTEHLKMFKFFSNFSEEVKLGLMNIMEEKIFQPGQIIFEDGETSNFSIYLIDKGRVDLYYDTRKSGSKYSVVKEIVKNEVFGSISFLTAFPRKCSAISKEISSIISIDRDQFLNLLKTSREEKDLQIFCQMKDKFLNNGDLSVLDLSCYQCGSDSHLSDQCVKTHYYIHRKAILKTLSSHYKILNRKKFKRFRDEKKHSLKLNADIQKHVAEFIEKFDEQINFLQEDIHMKRFQKNQSQVFSHNVLRQTNSSEQILPIQDSDDQIDYQQSSESSIEMDEQSNSNTKTVSNTSKNSQNFSENDLDLQNFQQKQKKKQSADSQKNLSNENNQSSGSGLEERKKIKRQRSGSMNNLSQYQQQPSITKQLEGVKSCLSNLNSMPSNHQNSHVVSKRMSQKNNSGSQNNQLNSVQSSLSANTPLTHVNSDIKNDEIEEFLNINNEQTISSIFQNFQQKKQQTKEIGGGDQQLNRQRSSYKQNSSKQPGSTTNMNASINRNSMQKQNSSLINNKLKQNHSPKISVSCSDLDQQSPSNINNNIQQNGKKSLRNSLHGNIAGDRRKSSIASFVKDNFETSSSTESNTTELFFDPQLAPLNAYPQSIPTQTAFEQGNIFIIEAAQNQSEEKNLKKTKFEILQEKMKDDDTESTPVSLLESIYNVDTHNNNAIQNKRKGILPYQTSLSENMMKIARLYSKGSTIKLDKY